MDWIGLDHECRVGPLYASLIRQLSMWFDGPKVEGGQHLDGWLNFDGKEDEKDD